MPAAARTRVLVLTAALAAALTIGCGGGGHDGASAHETATPPAGGESTATPPEANAARGRPARLQQIGTFAAPTYVTAPPGDRRRVFVVEQPGRIRVVRGGKILAQPFLDLTSQVGDGGERGLLSLAFAPDYRSSGRFYVYFTDRAGTIRVVEYRRRTADRADPGSARLVLSQVHPATNHNGGLLLFGPDGDLYLGPGDGGQEGDPHDYGQNLGTIFGKILRIDPRPADGRPYGVPRDNPFGGRAGTRPEIYASGLRNPWRFTFDPRTKDLIVADVGQEKVEEVTVVGRPGANLGWSRYEGRELYKPGEQAPGAIFPDIQRFHSAGNCSIIGGPVVRDRALRLRGRYLFGDYCTGRIESAVLRRGHLRDARGSGLHVESLSSFGEDGRGRVYATSTAGPVYRLVPR